MFSLLCALTSLVRTPSGNPLAAGPPRHIIGLDRSRRPVQAAQIDPSPDAGDPERGVAGYKIEMLYANTTNVVFDNGEHIQVTMEDSDASNDWNYYRLCAVGLARQFFSDPQRKLHTGCAKTRKLRLVQ